LAGQPWRRLPRRSETKAGHFKAIQLLAAKASAWQTVVEAKVATA
jgi:hypothetical protein